MPLPHVMADPVLQGFVILLGCVLVLSVFFEIKLPRPGFARHVLEDRMVDAYPRTRTAMIRDSVHWFIQIRWCAMLAAGVLTCFAVFSLKILPMQSARNILILLVILCAFNIAFAVMAWLQIAIRTLVPFQIYVDLVILAFMLHYSGGFENPCSLLVIFHVIVAGILLEPQGCFLVTLFSMGMLSFLSCAEWFGLLDHYAIHFSPRPGSSPGLSGHYGLYVAGWTGLQCVLLLLTAFFVTSLSERNRRDEEVVRRITQKALADRQLLEKALDTTQTGIRVIDRHAHVCLFNKRWEDWFMRGEGDGKTADPWRGPLRLCRFPCGGDDGASGSDAVRRHPDMAACLLPIRGMIAPLQDALQRGKVQVREFETPTDMRAQGHDAERDETAQTFQLKTAPLFDDAGNLVKIVELVQNITSQKRVQAQMLHASKFAAIGELAGHVAHEVNNPLGIISAKSRLLLARHRGDMSEKVAGEIDKMVHLADRVTHIARGLLSFCRTTGSRRESLDLRNPARSALALIEERAHSAGVAIEENFQDAPPLVWANAGEMEQVFLNMFLNALDAMPGGGKLHVRMERLTRGGAIPKPMLKVVVKDTGCGIPEPIRQRIFEPFFSTKEEGKGTGLGLSICHGLLADHGGEITVESRVGAGSRFTFFLPLLT